MCIIKRMYTHQAVRFFKTRGKVAGVLKGVRHRSAIYQWNDHDLIPLGPAIVLHAEATKRGGRLPIDTSKYDAAHLKRYGLELPPKKKKTPLPRSVRIATRKAL